MSKYGLWVLVTYVVTIHIAISGYYLGFKRYKSQGTSTGVLLGG